LTLQINKRHFGAYTNLGTIAYYTDKKVDDAIQLFKQAIENDFENENYLAHYHLAYILEMEKGDIEQAKLHYGKAVEINPDDALSHMNLGSLVLGIDQLKAHFHYKQAVAIRPNDYLANSNVAITYSKQFKWEEAVKYMTKAIELQPNNPHTYTQLGNIYFNNELYAKSIECYHQALDTARENPETFDIGPTLNNLLITLRKLAYLHIRESHHLNLAVEYLKEAISLSPDHNANFYDMCNMAYTYMNCNKPVEAEKCLAEAMELGGDEYIEEFQQIKQEKGWIAEVKIQLKEHIKIFTSKSSKKRAKAHFNAAFCSFHMGELISTLYHLRKAISYNPEVVSNYATSPTPPPPGSPSVVNLSSVEEIQEKLYSKEDTPKVKKKKGILKKKGTLKKKGILKKKGTLKKKGMLKKKKGTLKKKIASKKLKKRKK